MVPVSEDGGDGVTAGLLVLLGAVGRKRRSRRSFGRRRGGEAVAMAAANGVGGDGCVRASEREEAEVRRATGRVIERSRGFDISMASSRRIGEGPGRQGGRRWPTPRR